MSTKIYTAWRMPIKVCYNEFIPLFREHCFNKVSEQVKNLYSSVKDEVAKEVYDKYNWKDKMSWEDYLKSRGNLVKARHVLKFSYLASESIYRGDPFNLDCSLNIWMYNNKAYVIPYGDYWVLKDFNAPSNVEDYSYWNNTDPPEDMPYSKWEARGKMWDKVCLEHTEDWHKRRLLHEVVNIKSMIGNIEIWRKIFGKDEDIGMALVCEYDVEDITKKLEEKKIKET
jgi:copper chaperone CopZ